MSNEVDVKVDVLQEVRAVETDMIKWRRDLHQIPELGLELPKTSAYVQARLKEMGIPFTTLVNGNAVVGLIEGAADGPTLAIRADMDALPIAEETGLPFAATNGWMHACGHDGHTAMLLGAAKVLNEHRHLLKGRVKLLFQPGEEYPGGAKPMIEEGCMENPKVDYVIGLHEGNIDPSMPSGVFAWNDGAMMASMDRFLIEVKGQGSHGAYPELAHDPIVTAGQLIGALQTIKSRNVKATDPTIVSICRVEGGFNQNIIPDKVELEGTVRALNDDVRHMMARRIEEISKGIGAGMGVECKVTYDFKYPAVINDKETTHRVKDILQNLFGEERVIETPEPRMGGEDFAYYLQEAPGTFLFLSNPNPVEGTVYPHHHAKFDVDESLFYMGAAAFVQVALEFLN